MKNWKDIERLSMTDLERIAADESIEVPSTLKRDISITARALEMASGENRKDVTRRRFANRKTTMFAYPAAAVVVIAIGLSTVFKSVSTPKDTFCDPQMAYNQIEEVFSYISEKMNTGMDIASKAEPAFEKTIKAIR